MVYKYLILLFAWISFGWSPAVGQGVDEVTPALLTDRVTLVSGEEVLYLNETAEVQLDADGAWAQRGRFKLYGARTIDFGYLARPVWVMFRVKNDSVQPHLGTISIGRPELKIAEIYLVGEAGPEPFYLRQTDQTYPQRFKDYLVLAKPTEFAPNETKTVLMRIQSSHSSALPLAVGHDAAFRQRVEVRLRFVFIFTAIALTIIILNITLMILIGQARLLWFPASQIAGVISGWQVNRYFYLFVNEPGRELSRFVDQLITMGAILLLVQFARVFFETKEKLPWIDRVALGMIAIGSFFVGLEFVGLVTGLYAPGLFIGPTTLIWLTCFGLLIWIATSARMNGVAGAGWIFLAWIIYGSLVTYMVIEGVTVLPPLPYQSDLMIPMVSLEAAIITHALGYFARKNMQQRVATQKELATAWKEQFLAQRDLADRSRLLLAMGHDGRNLLGGLNHLSERILDADTLEGAKTQASRLQDVSTMFADMLNIMVDNADSGGGTHGPILIEPVNVDRLLATVCIVAGKTAAQKGIEVRVHAGMHEVMTDHLRVFRILANLMSNAGKYSSSGKILLACRRHGDVLRFQVFDQGDGLSEEEVASLKEAKPVRFNTSVPGEGVGLTICQEFARDLGGELLISSAKGRGSLFELQIPVTSQPPGTEKIRVGILETRDRWPSLARQFELVEVSSLKEAHAEVVDVLLLEDGPHNFHEHMTDLPHVLVATFEKTSEIRARWAGKAVALIYSPVSADAVFAALKPAGINITKRIKGAVIDDANTDRRRPRPRPGGPVVKT